MDSFHGNNEDACKQRTVPSSHHSLCSDRFRGCPRLKWFSMNVRPDESCVVNNAYEARSRALQGTNWSYHVIGPCFPSSLSPPPSPPSAPPFTSSALFSIVHFLNPIFPTPPFWSHSISSPPTFPPPHSILTFSATGLIITTETVSM